MRFEAHIPGDNMSYLKSYTPNSQDNISMSNNALLLDQYRFRTKPNAEDL